MSFTRVSPVGPEELGRWQAQLDGLTPRDQGKSWFLLRWEPGEPWAPVQRWLIWEMFPYEKIPAFVLEDLEGPDPRTKGYFDTVLQRFVPSESCVSKAQWDLFRETRCLGKPFWVIQGMQGGHKRYYSTMEAKLFEMIGMPTEPPAPGQLAYAPFDNRVVDAITEGAALGQEWSKAQRLTLPESKQAAMRALHERLVKYLFARIEDAVGDQRIDPDSIARGDEPRFDLDEVTEQFINS